MAGLTVGDVDFEADVVHVMGKGRRGRALPVGQQIGVALGQYLRVRRVINGRHGRSCGCRRRAAAR